MPAVVQARSSVRPVQEPSVEAGTVTAVGIVFVLVFASLVCYGFLCDLDRWVRRELEDDFDVFGGTRREIRALPEVPDAPFDWELENAA